MTDTRKKIAKALGAASEMRLALSGHVAFDVAARKWDDAAQEAYDAVCSIVEPRANLSPDLVRAGYLAGVMDVQKIASDAEVFDVSDEAEYLSADREAVDAIVAQVMDKD